MQNIESKVYGWCLYLVIWIRGSTVEGLRVVDKYSIIPANGLLEMKHAFMFHLAYVSGDFQIPEKSEVT